MLVGTVISYIEDNLHPRAQVTLPNRDCIQLTLDRDVLAIVRLGGPEQFAEVLFQADPDLASRMCAGLVSIKTKPQPTPLRILVAAVVQLGSAAKAFREVAAHAL